MLLARGKGMLVKACEEEEKRRPFARENGVIPKIAGKVKSCS